MTVDLSTPDPPLLTPEQAAAIAAIAAQAAIAAVKQMGLDAELKLYTAEEVGALIGKGAWWLEDRARSGSIPCTYQGRSLRFTAEHIRAIHAQGEVAPTARRTRGRAKPRTKVA